MRDVDTARSSTAEVYRLVDTLDVPRPWNLIGFVDALACARGRAIRLIPHSGLAGRSGTYGLSIARDGDDIIVYDDATSSYHAEQIVLHEIGHVLLEHTSPEVDVGAPPVLIEHLLPDLDPATVRCVLGRSAFDAPQERQAELFASLVMSQCRNGLPRSVLLRTLLRN
jgi:hypothetical protein